MIIVMCMKKAANYLTPFCSDTRYATIIQFCDSAINGGHAVRGAGLRPFRLLGSNPGGGIDACRI